MNSPPPSISDPTAPIGSTVFRASKRFRERRFPAGTTVQHPVHGRGNVQACRGTLRVVSFATRILIPVDQALRRGLVCAADVDAEQITHITMLEVEEATVQAAELQLAERASCTVRACVIVGLQGYTVRHAK